MTWDQLKREVSRLRTAEGVPERPSDAQRADWAYGNSVMENRSVTREMAETAAREITPSDE